MAPASLSSCMASFHLAQQYLDVPKEIMFTGFFLQIHSKLYQLLGAYIGQPDAGHGDVEVRQVIRRSITGILNPATVYRAK